MSEEKTESVGNGYSREGLLRGVCGFLAIFLLLAGVTALVVWLVYRPQKPEFVVMAAAIYNLNISAPPFVSTTIQFTVVTRNPNKRVSIYYDRLSAFVSYRNQAITPPTALPPLYHDKHSTVALSPILGGSGAMVPVSVEVANGLAVDEAYGVVGLKLVLLGRLRWKAGAIRTAHYGVYIKCDVLLGLKEGFVGQAPLLGSPACFVDV
ncbi:Late embryogenesis abundant protein, LEA_2 subgroup [Dillenia turbinata]|uniref:Late embryogenesis abundant protein, LEA_2 subgroup n=1 Tax=Dillenia turbinata TaxID=194707 RepID=A0AAN8UNB6_9MAGN